MEANKIPKGERVIQELIKDIQQINPLIYIVFVLTILLINKNDTPKNT